MANAAYSPFSRTRGVVSKPVQMVLVADSGSARMLRINGTNGSRSLTEIAQMELPVARMASREMVTDKPGRVFDRVRRGNGPRSAARHDASDTDPHTVEYARFAKRISRRLDDARRSRAFDELFIIAAPEFLGVLRPQLSGLTRRCTVREIPKDLVRASDEQILRSARVEQ